VGALNASTDIWEKRRWVLDSIEYSDMFGLVDRDRGEGGRVKVSIMADKVE
jgi:hypothetical protein